MIKDFQGRMPVISEKTYIADGCFVIGDVIMEEYSSLWYNCVARGDVNSIRIGKYTNIQDGSVVHVADECPTVIGDYVTVGHRAIIHGCTIEDHCLIGMGAVVMNNAVIGRGSIVAAGAVVKENQVVPPFSLVAGVPAKIVRAISEETDKIHAQAIKYKTLWSEKYGYMIDAGGETYKGEKIV
ncbi:MAG: gamma carbonic anhydrase family protein [Sedimentibacter sp.]|uniref:gamma carbonic anhydrase family protein n=1 Tax=Sedimentibacter sp. TaxID=1960295 RepID=UPI0031595D42